MAVETSTVKEKNIIISDKFRSQVQKKFPDKPGKIYGVTSGKGGVGKTSFAAMMAYGVASQGYATLIIDLDTGLRNLDIIMGVDAYIEHNLFDVLERGEDFGNAALKAPGKKDENGHMPDEDKLPWICVSIQEKIKNAIAYDSLSTLLDKLRDVFDVIILDGPAGIEYGIKLVTLCADEYFIVCTPNNASVRGADQINKMQMALVGESRPSYVVVNQYIPEMVASDGALSSDDIALFLQLPVAVTLPMDVSVSYCGHNGLSVWYMDDCNIKPAITEFIHTYFPANINDDPRKAVDPIHESGRETDITEPKVKNNISITETKKISEDINKQMNKDKEIKDEKLQKAEPADLSELKEDAPKKGFFASIFSMFSKKDKK